MKTVLKIRYPLTNVLITFKSNGNQLFAETLGETSNQPFGAVFEDERSYVNGVIDAIQAFSKFKIIEIKD